MQNFVSRVKHRDSQDPPLALDSEFSQSDTAWAKSMERLKGILALKSRCISRCLEPLGNSSAGDQDAIILFAFVCELAL